MDGAAAEIGTGGQLVNKRELARRVLDCSLPTLDDMLDRWVDFPIEARGSYGVEWRFDPVKVVAFIRQKKREDEQAAQERSALFAQFTLPIDEVAGDEAKGMTPTQRAQLAQARIRERQLAIESGLLVNTAELRQDLTTVLARFGRFLDQLAGRVASDHNLPPDVARAMKGTIEEQRRVFVRDMQRVLQRDTVENAPAA
jgi:phage terminase Nu1 subunit (DNA packaging protein)